MNITPQNELAENHIAKPLSSTARLALSGLNDVRLFVMSYYRDIPTQPFGQVLVFINMMGDVVYQEWASSIN